MINKNTLIRNFAIGFIPIFVFILADELFETTIGLIVAIATGLIYLIYYYYRYKKFERFILYDTVLISVLGGISLLFHDDIFFKLKPALVELILVALLGVHAFSSKPILLDMSKRYMKGLDIQPQQAQLMKKLSRLLFVVFLVHTILIIYSAYFLSRDMWAFISGGLFYILFGVILLVQWIYIKYIKNRRPVKNGVQGEEWFDIVDQQGKVINKAPRSKVHGNPDMIHPVVHLHVFNRNGQLYLQKRSQNKDLYPGFWDTAVGGHVSAGEKIEQALLREAKEELGLDARGAQPLFRYVMRNNHESELIHAFKLKSNGPFKINREEIEIGRFWTGFEIRRMIGKGVFTPNFESEFKLLENMKLV